MDYYTDPTISTHRYIYTIAAELHVVRDYNELYDCKV